MPTQSSIRSTYRKHLLNIPENIKKTVDLHILVCITETSHRIVIVNNSFEQIWGMLILLEEERLYVGKQ